MKTNYPFGMLQQGLFSENSSPPYRVGINGMLRDDDVKDLNITATLQNEGTGNTYDIVILLLCSL